MNQPSFNLMLTLPEINATVTALAKSKDSVVRKLERSIPGSATETIARAEYLTISSALGELMELQDLALLGEAS